ncbi:hypothetical protein FY112_00125 [Rhizobium sp. PEPV16]|nr:hypothetical protein FY112_00125 [Rhizobium sp. PEPV16]
MLGAGLNPEQRIAVQCVAETGAQPYAAAACIAVRLTLRELQKCVEGDFGGDGCFGDNNDLVGKNGWTMRTLSNAVSDVIYGPGQNHDLFGRKGWLGTTLENVRSDVENGVGENNDAIGKKGWACQRLGCEDWSPF